MPLSSAELYSFLAFLLDYDIYMQDLNSALLVMLFAVDFTVEMQQDLTRHVDLIISSFL